MSHLNTIIIWVAGLLQLSVAGYALRLNRLFGTVHVGWSLFWAFLLLALLHLVQPVVSFPAVAQSGIEIEALYAFISLLLLIGLVHLETVLKERMRVEREEHRMRVELELEVQKKTAFLTRALEELQEEIDEHKQVDMEFRSIFEQTAVGIATLNPEGCVIRSNGAAQQFLGYAEGELCGKHFTQLTHPEDEPAARQAFAELLDGTDGQYQSERRCLRKDGGMIVVRLTVSVTREPTRKPQSVIVIMEDITERKQTEQRLAETLDFNWRIISDVPVGIVVFEASGPCVMANKTAARIIHGTVAEMLKLNFRQLKSWRESGLLEAAEKTLATQHPQKGEFHFVSTFGKEVWVEGHLSCFVRNNQRHLLSTFDDIAERRRAEEALVQEERLFRSLMDNIPDRIYFKDAQSRFLRNSRAHLQIFGLTDPEEARGKTDFDFFSEEHARQALGDEQRLMKTGAAITVEEKETWPDGRVSWALTTKLPLRNEQSEIVGTFGISRDITERKVAEEKIREQAALLDQAQDAIWVIDAHERINYWNQGAELVYGWSAAEAVGKNPLQLLYRGAPTPQLLECMKALNERGEWRGELQEFTKDGRTITVQGRGNLIRDEQGRRKSILIINTDITERKKLKPNFSARNGWRVSARWRAASPTI